MTDASLVLGYLNPERFAGGLLTLDGGGRARARSPRRRAARPRRGRGGGRASIASSTRAWPTRSAWSRSSAGTTRVSSRWSSSAAPGPCTASRSPRRWAWPRCSCPRPRASSPPSACSRPPSSTTTRARCRRRTEADDLDAVNRCLAELDAAGRERMGRGGRAGRPACASPTRPTCATSARRTSWRCRSGAGRGGRIAELVRGSTRSTSASTATRAPQQPVEFVNFRAVHTLPAALADGDAGSAREGARRGARRRAPGVLRRRHFVATSIYERARLPLGPGPGPAIVEQATPPP